MEVEPREVPRAGRQYGTKMDLLLAADAGDLALVRELLKAPYSAVSDANKVFTHPKFNHRSTALHYASRSGHLAVVVALVGEFGAKVNVREIEDWTPVYYAANNGHTDIVEYLVEHGADVTIRDNFRHRSPLDVAQYRQFHDIVQLLSAAEARHQATSATAPPGGPAAKSKGKGGGRGRGAARRTGKDQASSYIRSQEEIEKEGNRKVFSGVHKKHMDLFLGRYRLPEGAPKLIQHFREATANEDITYEAVDTVLEIPVRIRHSHNRERHTDDVKQRREAGDTVLRSSVLSTNEFMLVTVS